MIVIQAKLETLTMLEAAENWLAEERKPASQRTFASYAKIHIGPMLGNFCVKDVKNGVLRQFAQALAAKKLSAKTVQEILSAVKSIIADCVDSEGERLFPRDWNSKFIGAMPVRDQNTPCATSEEIQGAIARSSGLDQAIIVCLAGTGLRIGELQAVRIGPMEGRTHWSTDKALIEVKTSIFDGVEQEPKTPSAVRVIEITTGLNSYLKDYAASRKDAFLFGNSHAPKLSTLRDHFDKVLPGHGFHSLRRFRASFLEEQACQPSIAKYWLGHAVGTEVHERYLKSAKSPARRREECERIDLGFEFPL